MTEPKPTATQCQQAAMKALAQADALVIQARKHLEELSPLLKNSGAYEDMIKLSRKINEVLAKVNGLSIS